MTHATSLTLNPRYSSAPSVFRNAWKPSSYGFVPLNGIFVKYVVHRRQRALLGLTSEFFRYLEHLRGVGFEGSLILHGLGEAGVEDSAVSSAPGSQRVPDDHRTMM